VREVCCFVAIMMFLRWKGNSGRSDDFRQGKGGGREEERGGGPMSAGLDRFTRGHRGKKLGSAADTKKKKGRGEGKKWRCLVLTTADIESRGGKEKLANKGDKKEKGEKECHHPGDTQPRGKDQHYGKKRRRTASPMAAKEKSRVKRPEKKGKKGERTATSNCGTLKGGKETNRKNIYQKKKRKNQKRRGNACSPEEKGMDPHTEKGRAKRGRRGVSDE